MRVKVGDLLGRYVRILCDGEEINRCIWVDEEAGLAKVYRVDGNGRILVEGDSAAKSFLKGEFRVELLPDVPAAVLRQFAEQRLIEDEIAKSKQ